MGTYDFTGKVALVTGGASGIGEACVRSFAQSGAEVVVADFDEDNGARVVGEIGEDRASFVRVDVSDASQVEAMVAHAVERFGGLDVAVNNAGIGGASAPVGEYPLDSWAQVIDVNLNGVFYGLRYQIPAMLERGGGAIVNMASILGSVGIANSGAYVAAKHAVVGLTKSAALEYSAQGVRVNSVGPGFVTTPLLEKNLDADTMKGLEQVHAVKRLGVPDEVAALVSFLSSDEASFCSGGYYLVDGGYTAQ